MRADPAPGWQSGRRPRSRRLTLPAQALRSPRLRTRLELSFGLLALAVSLVVAVLSWAAVSGYLLVDRQRTTVNETMLDRSTVVSALARGVTSVGPLLDSLPTNDTQASVARVAGHWYTSRSQVTPSSIPPALVAAVTSEATATQRVLLDGTVRLVVGTPLSRPGDGLFQVFPLSALERKRATMAWGLALGAVMASLSGVALGRWASRVALRPLSELTSLAQSVAGGRLNARLRVRGDPDLDPLARSFNDTVAQLEHRVQADSRFAADLSHELRTPLTTMLNSMEVITNRRELLPEAVREPVDLLADDLARFRALVVDLLEISRHDAGEELLLEAVDVGELVRRAADSTAGRPVTRIDAGPDLEGQVDKRRLERVVANLVANAEHHGGGCVAVTVQRGGDDVRIIVDDAGPGIPEAERAQVFDRFARAGGSGELGVGLGLAIVQRHVSAHGGTVHVSTSELGGARFVVEIPLH